MIKSLTSRQSRVLALSLALGLIAAANAPSAAQAASTKKAPGSHQQLTQATNVPPIPHAASSRYPLFPLIPKDRYVDPRTGISRPDNPSLNGG